MPSVPSSFDKAGLLNVGFTGFVSFADLYESWLGVVPQAAGVYAVLRESDRSPKFLKTNPGGHFKGRDPTVSIATLRQRWVDGCNVVYIGKGDDLRRRLKEFARFGRGEPVGHWGGRLVWQLADVHELVVTWRKCEGGQTARALETELLSAFRERYGSLPFANLNA